MRDIVFLELRKCSNEIRKITDATAKKLGNVQLSDTLNRMCEFAVLARKEGLLSLEIAANNLSELKNGKYLEWMTLLITDGTNPDLVEELCLTRYFAAGLEEYDALQYLMMMCGALGIQAGENSRIIEEKLIILVPEDVEKLYRKKQEEKRIAAENEYSDSSVLEKYYEGDIAASQDDPHYIQLKIVDYVISILDDLATQRLLRDVDNLDLALALKGLSGKIRKQIFMNLSTRVAIMITQDMEFMGKVTLDDITNAALKIFTIIVRLIDSKEMVCDNAEVIRAFENILEIESEKKNNMDELYQLMRELGIKKNNMKF